MDKWVGAQQEKLSSLKVVYGIFLVFSKCPASDMDTPTLHLTADVPAYALARCRNGDKPLTAVDAVNWAVDGSFSQSYVGTSCQFYKKEGIRTYTVDVEVGWGERDAQIIQERKIHTISCAYDAHGKAVSKTETIAEWFLNPWEQQTLLGGNSTAAFTLKVMDVLGNEVTGDHISIGRKIQLVAWDITGRLNSFRALSCAAVNSQSRYYILRAGCGDGLIFPKTIGFETRGNCVYSPWFEAFKLSGGDSTIRFECTFTACGQNCDGV
ncbi:vitelline envelope sperm lysin receptor-like [Liolophura sinensis]|uniref:vitelline envelope sperm lysin receptor-like n=1 Tax=Liolophura sinensis TaxID=3198878 RepID=UPI003158DC6F